jgi:Xaa-Pro aminopeptidase
MGDRLRADWSGRLDRAWRAASAPGRAAFVVSTPVNLSYLCGFNGSQGLLVLSEGPAWLLLDGRYAHAVRGAIAAGQAGPVEVRLVPGRFDQALASLLPELPEGDVAFEAEHVTVATLATWQKAVNPRALVATSGVIETLRSVKDAQELQAIRRACTRLSDVARGLKNWVAGGRTERAVAADIDAALFQAGFERLAFPTIVASGPNSAHPHARPGDRLLQNGDLVVLDFGGVLDGYCGDLTRMATVGQPRAETLALVNAVRAAQDAALTMVRPGVLAADVDGAARGVLTRHGLGEAFLHATGHGLGLEVHEAPRIGRADADRVVRLQAGMVCTIEPGAYVDGLGGARMEDDILVTADGCEVLTDAPRDLLVV